ncbi:hypothetical protein VZO05_09555 [Aggregatilineales bacterium SYSU G02658]
MIMMMRGMFILVLLLTLAACGGSADTPTQAALPDAPSDPSANVDPAAEATAPAFVIVTRAVVDDDPEILATLPSPDEISVASATEDPDIDLIFDQIELFVYGGEPGAERIELVVRQDGSFVRNGVAGRISEARVLEIDRLIDALNFFGLNANFISLAETRNRKYQLRIDRGTLSRTIQSEDGFMPVEYRLLLAEILNVGVVP